MNIDDLKNEITKMVSDDDTPIVVFCALWPILMQMDGDKKQLSQDILNIFLDDRFKNRDILMPTFASGYGQTKTCNLDNEPSTTGLLSELFRNHDKSQRNLSAFFSFNIVGPNADDFCNAHASHSWGAGSAYEWMENQNAHFLMLGTHPTHCSYLHRIEWLARDYINYRYDKTFQGTIIRDGKSHDMTETLYVRSLDPELVNDFTPIEQNLINGGMTVTNLDGVNMAHMRAKNMKDAYLPLLQKDPYITVKNREDFENKEQRAS